MWREKLTGFVVLCGFVDVFRPQRSGLFLESRVGAEQ